MDKRTAATLSPATLEALIADERVALERELGNLHSGLQDAGHRLVEVSRAVAALPRDGWGSALGCACHDVQRVEDFARRALRTAHRLERIRSRLEELHSMLCWAEQGSGQ